MKTTTIFQNSKNFFQKQMPIMQNKTLIEQSLRKYMNSGSPKGRNKVIWEFYGVDSRDLDANSNHQMPWGMEKTLQSKTNEAFDLKKKF